MFLKEGLKALMGFVVLKSNKKFMHIHLAGMPLHINPVGLFFKNKVEITID